MSLDTPAGRRPASLAAQAEGLPDKDQCCAPDLYGGAKIAAGSIPKGHADEDWLLAFETGELRRAVTPVLVNFGCTNIAL